MEHSIYSSLILAVAGLFITFYYSGHTLKLSRDKMTKELLRNLICGMIKLKTN
jgi:hypothetical protein